MHVYLTRNIPEAGLKLLEEEGYDLEIYPGDSPVNRSTLFEGVEHADGLLCLLTDEIDADVMDRGEDLRVISNFAVGYDNIDVHAATERGILVTNTPGVLTRSTAELTWALLFSTVRRVVEADQFVRDGKFKGWAPTLYRGMELKGNTLGILGAGRIGREVGRIGASFGMKILYHSRERKKKLERETNAKFADLDYLLAHSDVLSLHVPLTDETDHMIGENELRSMKQGAYLINTARGQVVDEEALVKVLKDEHLAGAGLDVFEEEPDVHPELLEMEQVVLLPHIGSATHRTRNKMAEKAAQNLIAGLKGKHPPDPVNENVL